MSVVREALEALGHAVGAPPELRLLADLFVRFQAQVPLRASPGGGGEEHLSAWLEGGAGLCGAGRTSAFEALATEAGFRLSPAAARDGSGAVRRVLLADGGRLLLDPSFPLPAPLSLDPPAEAQAAGYGTLSVRRESGAAAVILETRGEERLLFTVGKEGGTGSSAEAVASSEDEAAPAALFRLLEDRLLRFREGLLEVSDAWSRLRVPFPALDADGLEALFGAPIPGHLPGAAAPAEPTLAVYHASATGPDRLRALLGSPATHAAILPEGWSVANLVRTGDAFEQTLAEDGRFLRRERVDLRPDGLTVAAEGPLALFRTRTWRLESRGAGTRLRLFATLRDPVPPRGLPEPTRRRLVFELASELLALDRLASGA